MHNVVLDTNVYISGILFGGKAALLLKAVQDGTFSLFVSASLHREIEKVLVYKFHVSDDVMNDVRAVLQHGIFVIPHEKVTVCRDPKDNFLLELSHECKAEYFVTGDKEDLLPMKQWQSTAIISPAEAVKLFCEKIP